MDAQDQLAELRRRIARIDRKYLRRPSRPVPAPPAKPSWDDSRPARYFVEDLIDGEIVETAAGAHFQTERLYPRHKRHGNMDISALAELPDDLLEAVSGGTIARSNPERWAFLDTETSGLAGGAGNVAFLVGVGSIGGDGFRVRQFFMRDDADERSLLEGLVRHLSRFDVLITYNGKSYDQPLLEARYRMARQRSPFERMQHLDLLHGARRLWKRRFETCRLVDLENRILGLERQGDLPGEMIPYYYFDYLRTRQAFRLVPIFHHNLVDIASLACLTGVVPFAFRAPEQASLLHGPDLIGLARWLVQAEEYDRALGLYRRAVEIGLPDDLLFRTLWDIGILEKKLDRADSARAVFADLASSRNPYRAAALEELAKHYEHGEKDLSRALEMTVAAIQYESNPDLRRREDRLRRRLTRRRSVTL